MNAETLQTSFGRAVEARYARRTAAYRAAGLDSEEARMLALEDAKRLGREVLDELRQRGLFPWASDKSGATPSPAAPREQEGGRHVR